MNTAKSRTTTPLLTTFHVCSFAVGAMVLTEANK